MPLSNYPSVHIPDVDIWSFIFERQGREFPDDKIIYQDVDTQRYYSFLEAKEASLQFGKGLQNNYGWQHGDVLALFTPNSIDIPIVSWGTHWAGGVVSPANPAYTPDELAYQLTDSGAKLLVTQLPLLATALKAAEASGIPRGRIILIGDQQDCDGRFPHFTSIRGRPGKSYQKAIIKPESDLAFLVYSSGTTGLPKGVMLSHRNIVANILQMHVGDGGNLSGNSGSDGKGDRVLGVLPFYHIYGLTCLVHQAIYSGLHLYVMAKFDLERWCSHVQNYRITFAYVAPPIVLLLSKHPLVAEYDLSTLRLLNSGAAPLTRELVEATHARIGVGVKQGYGLSETSPGTHTQPWHEWNISIGSVGRLLPNLEAKYMTIPGDGSKPAEVAEGKAGELYLRGPNIFLGYHNKPAATAECLSADGWFRTGDVGFQDRHGNFYITDRVKELIKYKGFQVAPAELEGILLGHEWIDDVGVVGVDDKEQATELPLAFVVQSPNGKAVKLDDAEKAARLISWMDSKVAHHKRLRGGMIFVTEIPKNPSGKILRRLLKERAVKERANDFAPRL